MYVLKYYYLGYTYWVARYFTVVACYLVNIHMNDRFYRAMQLPSAVLGVAILCVRPSVRLSYACFVTNPKNLPTMFLYHMKGQFF